MNVILTAAIASASVSALLAGVVGSGSPAKQEAPNTVLASRAGPWTTDRAQDNETLLQHAMSAPVKQWWGALGTHGACRAIKGSPFTAGDHSEAVELFAAYAEDDGYTLVFKRTNGDYVIYAGSEADCGAMKQGLLNQGI